jgi:hypothetical protein
MTILSYGYADGSVQAQQWALMAGFMGHGPTVAGASDWNVTAVTGVDRRVQVALGTGFGRGVLDVSDTAVNLDLPTTTGVKYATIFAHRNWAGGVTYFRYSTYGTTNAVSANLYNDPGVLDDQPLAIVRVTGGVQVPTVMSDERITIAQARSRWMPWQTLPLSSGIVHASFGGHTPQYRISLDNRVGLRGTVARSAGNLVDESIIATLPAEARANTSHYFAAASEKDRVGTSTGGSDIYTAESRVIVRDTGAIVFTNYGEPAWVSLDGIEFDRT